MLTRKKWPIILCTSLILMLLAWAGSVYGQAGLQVSGDAWMDNYTLILTDAQRITEAYMAADAIEGAGGHVYVIFPNRVMLGRVPADAVKGLVGKCKIRGIYHKPVLGPAADQILDEASANAIAFFNEVASGAWKAKKARARQAEAVNLPEMLPDAFQPPPLSYRDYMANLNANGISEEMLKAEGISLVQSAGGTLAPSPGNSDYMVGKVVFNAMFVESNGTVDPNSYTWAAADRTLIQNEIVSGLSWWSSQAQSKTFRTPLTYVYKNYYNWNTKTSYEPILHPSGDDYLWITEIMGKFGYDTGDKFARCTAFNTAKRIAYKANWSALSFIGYNPSPAASTFTNGYFAYAYLGGPYSQLLFRNDGWATTNYDVVNAHETGHLFRAQDEYYQAGYGGCTSCAVSTNGVYNGNCEYCNPNAQPCMMRGNNLALCGYTPGQIGWTGLRSASVKTYTTAGVAKQFFAPGQAIQYKCYYCLAGPRLGTTVHNVNVRFRADFPGGTIDSPATTYDDTGWAGAGAVAPPATTGLSCYITWWNRTVPAGATFGAATVSVQLTVEKYGNVAISDTARFYVAPGANATTSPLPASSVVQEAPAPQRGPFTAAAPLR
jgi:hypothetical protein